MSNPESKAVRACEAYNFRAMIGTDVIHGDDYLALRDNDWPNVWDLNFAANVTASSEAKINAMLGALAETYIVQGYCRFLVTPFTPPSFVAHIAIEDYQEHTPIVQMVLSGGLKIERSAGFRMTKVVSDDDWDDLFRLVRADHLEGARTQGGKLDVSVTYGIVEGYRRKSGPCQFFLAFIDDALCGYGSATTCPNGMGMIEDLFTLPHFRKRGAASSLIADCVGYVRDHGANEVLIGSLVSAPPKRLYQRLGFQPVCLTRSFHKQLRNK